MTFRTVMCLLSCAVVGLCSTGCVKSVPRVAVPASDATPPTIVWETYNMQTKMRGEIAKDGEMLAVPAGEQYVLTLAAEDLDSGVTNVTLGGDVRYSCLKDGQAEAKQYALESQEMKPVPVQEQTMPVRASLVYVVEFGKMGCKEFWTFGGGQLTLIGKAQNAVGATTQRTLHVQLNKPE